jgi:class 3 adenylate cyclase
MSTVIVEREIACKADPSGIWCAVADTERLNRAIGLGPIEARPVSGNGAARFAMSTISGGFPLEYEELPFEFEQNRRYVVKRIVTKGLFRSIENSFELSPRAEGGTNLSMRVKVEGANALVAPIVKIQVTRFLARIEQEVRGVDDEIAAGRAACFQNTRSVVDEAALARAAGALRESLSPERQALGARLVEHVRDAGDADVARMRPLELARSLSVDEREFLAICLTAVSAGLLELGWDLVCPSCRTGTDRVATLSELPRDGHCQLCDISYELEFDRAVEATFRPSVAIRRGMTGPFCIGGPMLMPHVVAQAIVPASGRASLHAPVASGGYRLFLRGGASARVRVSEGGPSRVVVSAGERELSPAVLDVAPGGEVVIEQALAVGRHVKLEQSTWASRAATAHLVSTLPEFRRVFSSDVLKPGITLRVARVALLFTDLTGSTALYSRVGDATAFSIVHEHFGVLSRVIAEHGGTVVKTIGDAVMASFVEERDAVRAGAAMHRAFPAFRGVHAEARDLFLRVGVHAGPCYVVTANGILDYFGQTVNVAARLQGAAQAGELVLSREAAARALAEGWLVECGEGRRFNTVLKGVEREAELDAFTLDAA